MSLLALAVLAALGDAPAVANACAGVDRVWVTVKRPGIPQAALVAGDCSAPDLLPLRLEALVLDAGGNPIAGCDVLFQLDNASLSSCGRAFGQFCPQGVTATTDQNGAARLLFTLTQADLDACNCLPADCACVPPTATCSGGRPGFGDCPTPSACAPQPTCGSNQDLFCQLAFRAAAGAVASGNVQYVEYGR